MAGAPGSGARGRAGLAGGVTPMETIFDRLSDKLTEAGVAYDVLRHAPVFTSEEAAAVRGTSLASGAKALVCKADELFVVIVVPADRRLGGRVFGKAGGG